MPLRRLFAGHYRLIAAIFLGLVCYAALPAHLSARTRAIAAWDVGAACFLVFAWAMARAADPARMAQHARAQAEGEWSLFWLVLAGISASFAAILSEFGAMKATAAGFEREARIGLVAATLALSWMLMHAIFALRYAHAYYRTGKAGHVRGLQFPGDDLPDYWDFFYFAAVLGMTFQVSDVTITSKHLRRLATVQGLLGFVFNTVIVALTVNLASGLLG